MIESTSNRTSAESNINNLDSRPELDVAQNPLNVEQSDKAEMAQTIASLNDSTQGTEALASSALESHKKIASQSVETSRPIEKNAATALESQPLNLCVTQIERLANMMMADQKRKHRWNLFFRFSWLLLVVAFVWLSFTDEQGTTTTGTPHTAVVQIKGEISDGVDASALHVVEALKAALEDPSTKAVVLLINSPGGSPVQAGIINDEIYRLKAIHKKPIYAVVEESCASAAYYIASAADQIYVDKASVVGSIGVLMDGFGFTGLMGKLGVERRLLTAGDNKGMLDPFSPQNPDQKAFAQQMLGQIHQQFIAVVRKGRGARLKETPETFSGLFWTGEQAIQMGLADHLGNIDYVAREVVKAKDIIDYTRKENVAERLAKRFGASIGEGMVKAMNAKTIDIK